MKSEKDPGNYCCILQNTEQLVNSNTIEKQACCSSPVDSEKKSSSWGARDMERKSHYIFFFDHKRTIYPYKKSTETCKE